MHAGKGSALTSLKTGLLGIENGLMDGCTLGKEVGFTFRFNAVVFIYSHFLYLLIHIQGRRAYPGKPWVEGGETPRTTCL